jgi:hypothetical protein
MNMRSCASPRQLSFCADPVCARADAEIAVHTLQVPAQHVQAPRRTCHGAKHFWSPSLQHALRESIWPLLLPACHCRPKQGGHAIPLWHGQHWRDGDGSGLHGWWLCARIADRRVRVVLAAKHGARPNLNAWFVRLDGRLFVYLCGMVDIGAVPAVQDFMVGTERTAEVADWWVSFCQ